MANIDDGLTDDERYVRRTALLLLHVYKKIKKRKKRSIQRISLDPHPKDEEGLLTTELYQILSTMENLERRMLLGDNNNIARMLSVWWIHQKRERKQNSTSLGTDKNTPTMHI